MQKRPHQKIQSNDQVNLLNASIINKQTKVTVFPIKPFLSKSSQNQCSLDNQSGVGQIGEDCDKKNHQQTCNGNKTKNEKQINKLTKRDKQYNSNNHHLQNQLQYKQHGFRNIDQQKISQNPLRYQLNDLIFLPVTQEYLPFNNQQQYILKSCILKMTIFIDIEKNKYKIATAILGQDQYVYTAYHNLINVYHQHKIKFQKVILHLSDKNIQIPLQNLQIHVPQLTIQERYKMTNQERYWMFRFKLPTQSKQKHFLKLNPEKFQPINRECYVFGYFPDKDTNQLRSLRGIVENDNAGLKYTLPCQNGVSGGAVLQIDKHTKQFIVIGMHQAQIPNTKQCSASILNKHLVFKNYKKYLWDYDNKLQDQQESQTFDKQSSKFQSYTYTSHHQFDFVDSYQIC